MPSVITGLRVDAGPAVRRQALDDRAVVAAVPAQATAVHVVVVIASGLVVWMRGAAERVQWPVLAAPMPGFGALHHDSPAPASMASAWARIFAARSRSRFALFARRVAALRRRISAK